VRPPAGPRDSGLPRRRLRAPDGYEQMPSPGGQVSGIARASGRARSGGRGQRHPIDLLHGYQAAARGQAGHGRPAVDVAVAPELYRWHRRSAINNDSQLRRASRSRRLRRHPPRPDAVHEQPPTSSLLTKARLVRPLCLLQITVTGLESCVPSLVPGLRDFAAVVIAI
jgi:hypothetical protein